MKKTIAILMVLAVMVSLIACGSEAANTSQTSAAVKEETEDAAAETKEESVEAEPEEPEVTEAAEEETVPEALEENVEDPEIELSEEVHEYALGDTVSTDWREFTLNDYSFTSFWGPNGEKNKSVSSGNVCMNVFFTVKNIGKKAFNTVNVVWMQADYNEGYLFDLKDTYHGRGQGSYVANSLDIQPLTDAMGFVSYFEVPKEIEEDSEHPLHVNVTLKYEDGTTETFVYVIR